MNELNRGFKMEDFTQYIIYAGGLLAMVSLYYFAFFTSPSVDDWLELPYLGEYLVKHPECETPDPETAKCCHCHSDKVLFQPLISSQDRRYKHFCTSCQNTLFRSRALS